MARARCSCLGVAIAALASCSTAESGPDAGPPDAGTPDSGIPDAGPSDAGPPDAGSPDAGPPDAGSPDGGAATMIPCAALAASPVLVSGQNLVLDLTGAPVCTLNASTDLVIGGAGTKLLVTNGTLEVQGNIDLADTSVFTVRDATLQIDNVTNFTRVFVASDSAALVFDHSTLVTNATGVNNVSSVYTGSGTSSAQFLFANVAATTSWLLATITESASLVAANSNVPNEIYLHDESTVRIEDDQVPSHPRAANGLWLRFADGASGTVELPDVTAPFSWQAGNGELGYSNVGWHLEVDTANPGIGIEPHAGSSVTVNGRGAARKEVGFGIYIDPAAGSPIAAAAAGTPYAIPDPPLGLVSDFALPALPGAASSQLTLHDVNLGALAWQIYVGGGAGGPPVAVNLGTGAFNEVAAFAGGEVNLTGTTMQLAVLEAAGAGAVVNATGSDLWSQTIQADSMGAVNLIDSVVHGGSLVASAGGTLQLNDGTALWADGVTTAPATCDFGADYAWMLANSGRPLCNPFARPGELSSRTVVGSGSVLQASHTHAACPSSDGGYAPALDFETGPPVTAASPSTLSCKPASGPSATASVGAYPFLLTGVQASTAYACTLTQGSNQQSFSVTTSACVY